MRAAAFLRSPRGNLVLLVAFAVVGGLLMYRGSGREKARSAQMTKVDAPDRSTGRESITREAQLFKVPAMLVARKPATMADAASSENEKAPDSQAHAARGPRAEVKPAKPRALPISLITTGTEPAVGPGLSKTYAPYGRMIPCETVVTLESSKLDTPVIGLVTEDVWHDGELIIPAGVEVHGRASLDRARERIAASGKWVLVWRDGSPLNGTELVLNGIALDRTKDETTGEFGLRDGSAGLLGTLVKTDNWQEIKLFAATFLGGMASGLQELRSQGGMLGDLVQVPVASGRNAALQGTTDVLNAYARQIQEAIARDGFFVRVPAGKQFYLYVTETIDQARGTRGNVANAELWRKPNEK